MLSGLSFANITSSEVTGSILVLVASAVASAAGVGGGILNVGIFLIVWNFAFLDCTMLSLFTLIGNFVAQLFLVNIWMHHPNDIRRPLIYYDAVLIFFPLQLGGANIGVVLSYMFPKTILLIAAVAVLLFALWISLKNVAIQYSTEIELIAKLGDSSAAQASEETLHLLQNTQPTKDIPSNSYALVEEDEVPMVIPWNYISVFIGVWLLYAMVYVSMELVSLCSWEFFLLLVIIYPFIIFQVMWSFKQLIAQQRASNNQEIFTAHTEGIIENGSLLNPYNSSVLVGDIKWDQLPVLPLVLSVLIGCLSVMLGIGGGEMMSPMLLSLNVKAEVIAATIPMMMILSSSSSIVHYMTLGNVPYGYGLWMSILGFLGGLSGRLLSLWFVKRTKRPSILLIAFCIILLISLGIYIYYVYLDLDELDFSFSSLC